MTQAEHTDVTRYLAAVRQGLKGLPARDVDDIAREIRTHLQEEIDERGDTASVLNNFGDPAEVASDIVERRVRPDDGPCVPHASLGRRYSAWATDVVIGLGPMLLVPTALTFSTLASDTAGSDPAMPVWIQISEHIAHWWLTALGYEGLPAPGPVAIGQWLLAACLLAWAVFYWMLLRRSRSASVGMWMTGLRGIRLDDDRIIVRERDIAQNPAPLGTHRNRWWILVPAVPVGCLCILLLIYYLWMCIGPFLPPRILG
ncbi:MAG: RDD family protein [Coriobacteriia bacterium]|nr:RDD family protein [Coriobacteriia bacterium]